MAEQRGMTRGIEGVSVVIPAYNEEGAIERTVLEAKRGLADFAHEILVVDDGSEDRTGELAERAGATVLRHPANVGYGRAVKLGVSRAQYDTIVIADGDGTYPLDRIPDLVARYCHGYDMVVGERSGAHLNETIIKRPLRALLRRIVEYTAGRRVPDVNSGLRVFSRATAMEHFAHLSNSFSFTTSLTLAYMMNGRFVAYDPIAYHNRVGTTKVRLFRESLRTLQYIIQALVYYNPIKLFLLGTAVCFALAAATIAIGIAVHAVSGVLVGVGVIAVGLLVFAMGLLADLLRQIMAKTE